MRPSFEDGWLLLYHYGVVLTGAYAVRFFELEDRWSLLAVALVVALAWTVYFRARMVPQLSRLRAENEES